MAAAFIGFLEPLASLLIKVFPENRRPADLSAPRYLDESALETPSLALTNAARETLRMGDFVETMLRQVMVAIMTNDRQLAAEVSRMDNTVDRLDEAIRLYLTKLTRGSLDEPEGHRAMQIISISSILATSSTRTSANLPSKKQKAISSSPAKVQARLSPSTSRSWKASGLHWACSCQAMQPERRCCSQKSRG
jgi:phosphate:Na+ symporter